MSDHIFTAAVDLSASATSAVPVFLAPYAGYIEKIEIAPRTAPIADAGSATTGDIAIRFKNERSTSYVTDELDIVGKAALSAVGMVMASDRSLLEFRKGDIITINQRVSALSAATPPGITTIVFHVRTARYGGQITQSYQPQ